MTELNLTLKLKADGSGLVGTVQVSKKELDKLKEGFNQTGDAAQKTEKKVNRTTTAFQRMRGGAARLIRELFSLKGLLATFISVRTAQDIAQAGIAMEGLDAGLTSATGSSKLAAQEIAFLRAEAERLGFQFDSNAKSYVNLSAASKGTALQGAATRDIFLSVAEASAVMRLSNEQNQGALLAVSQMMSKGTVSAEELRGQLGERLPGAFQIAARAMNVTTAQLGEMLQRGEILAEDFLPKFAQELRKSVAGGLPAAIDGSTAAFNRFHNAIFELKEMAIRAGFLDVLTSGAKSLTETIRELPLIQIEAVSLMQKSWRRMAAAVEIVTFTVRNAWNATLNGVVSFFAKTMDSVGNIMQDFPEIFSTDQVASVRALSDALKLSVSPAEDFAAGYARINKEMEKQLEIIDQQTQSQKNQVKNGPLSIPITEGIESVRTWSKEALKIIETTSDDMRNIMSNTLFDVFKNGKSGFEDFFANVRDMFIRLMADIAATAAARKILIPIGMSLGAGDAVAQGLGTTTAQTGAGINPLIGAGLLAGGFAVSSYLSNRAERERREEEARRRRIAAMQIMEQLTADIESNIRLLSGASSEAIENIRRADTQVRFAFKQLADTNDILSRAQAEQNLVDKMMSRYQAESDLLDNLKQKIDNLNSSLLNETESITATMRRIAGLPDYRNPADVIAAVSGLTQPSVDVDPTQLINSFQDIAAFETLKKESDDILKKFNNSLGPETPNQKTLDALIAFPEYFNNSDLAQRYGTFSYGEPTFVPETIAQVRDFLTTIDNAVKADLKLATTTKDELLKAFETNTKGYADALSNQIDILGQSREEIVRWYEAQKQLAATLQQSSLNISNVLTDLRRSQLTTPERTSDRLSEFRSIAAKALSSDGYELASSANLLTQLVDPLLADARASFASGSGYQTIYNEIIGTLGDVQDRVDELTPQGFEEASLTVLTTIDASVKGLSEDLKAILEAIETTSAGVDDVTKNQLEDIAKRLGGDINITVVTPDGQQITEQTIDTLEARSQNGEVFQINVASAS